ncbi:MAG: hypothetical protein EOO39_35335, partial [Cytophagaceae bacterium]
MRTYLFLLCMLAGLTSFAQPVQPKAVRLYRVNDQVVMADSLGAAPTSYPASQVSIRSFRNVIEVAVGSASVYYRPAQLLGSTGVAYGSTVTGAINAYLTLMSTSGFGGIADVNSTISNTTQSINSTGKIYLLLTNVGAAAATVTVGTASYPVAVGATWEYTAIQDRRSGLYT